MQIKNNQIKYIKKPFIILLVKILLMVGCLYFLVVKLQDQAIDYSQLTFSKEFTLVLFIVLVLMFFNWYLEAIRWKISLDSLEVISMKEAWIMVLSGLALNWIFPLASGDLFARISHQKDKYQATSAVIMNRSIMLFFTLIFGFYGMSYLPIQYELSWWIFIFLVFVMMISFLFRNYLHRFIRYYTDLTQRTFLKLIGLSLVRYIVFVFQYYLLIVYFLPDLASDLIVAGIGWMFLVRSILPSILGGVGVREASGIIFFESWVDNLQWIVIPVFLIWLINMVIPSLVGLVLVWKMKIGSSNP